MSRPRKLAIGALVVLLCAAPFVPRGGDDEDGAITPSGDQRYAARPAATAGASAVTAEARAEIERVVAEGRAVGRVAPGKAGAVAASLARCAELEGQRYCLGVGWTQDTEAEVQARVATAARTTARASQVEETGDLSTAEALRRSASLAPAERVERERAELTAAARAIAKVWLLRHQLEGVPLPAGFLERHPEARAGTTGTAARSTTQPTTTATKTRKDYPVSAVILRARDVADQTRSYWCGPTAMQMIAWGWQGSSKSQDHWARQLGTTTDGTGIYDMVREVNESTGYDQESYAGPYVVLDVSDYGYGTWLTLLMRHIVDYRAPVVLHPILHRRYYPYLDDDASGHFQVGRGYSQKPGKPIKVSYFEPWNQQRFDPSEPFIARVQWRQAYRSYRANLAHPQQNIGV